MSYFYVFWSLLLCLCSSIAAIYALWQRRVTSAALSLGVLACSYLPFQGAFDLYLNQSPAPASLALGALPRALWVLYLLGLTLAAVLLVLGSIRAGKRSLTPAAVKLCADRMPCGICYWRNSGQVIFSNHCMDRLCAVLTGDPLLNGNSFYEAVPEGIVTVGGRAWRFSARELTFDHGPLHEMIAADVTGEYAKLQALQEDTRELSRINQELQAYRVGIEDSVRRQEILQAKVNIHDEMNRLLLSIVTADKSDRAELDAVLSLWQQNALLLCREADRDRLTVEHIAQFAGQMNIRLVWQQTLPEALTVPQRELFASAAREAVINALKHARADTLTISFAETDGAVLCSFENGGNVPEEPVRFTGGLKNLAILAAQQGAELLAEATETFRLCLRFPK